jgi:non-specific serine/threonine protein kinase/serine/threonine-protein kinase
LDQACADAPEVRAEVQGLLDALGRAGSFMRSPAAPPPNTASYEPPITEGEGTTIGPYTLREQIGEGGFGLVFVAEQQQPVRRKVALKVIKPGMDTRAVVARFEAERQALAMMDHPHIAKVHDAGTTETGRPYFVMELVKGVPITEYADANNLTPRDRLGLFVQVCQAVQHAHQKGVIHRDLKPSNVLVAPHDGVPLVKVIDFGIAKALGQSLTEKTIYTRFAQMIGTPLYMSPEQAEVNQIDVDTRSDIYSLGVLLYELLTGTTPFDQKRFQKAAFDEIRRIIKEEEPPRPSMRLTSLGETLTAVSAKRGTDPGRMAGVVRGELDWIVMKCLEKDRSRRYETATGLAKDVQRYLTGDAVEACPPTLGYRLRKTYRKNRAAVLTAGAFAAVLVSALVATSYGLVRADVERQRAEAAERTAVVSASAAMDAAEAERRAKSEAQAAERQARQDAALAKAVRDFLQNDLLLQAAVLNQAERLRLVGGAFDAKANPTVRELLDRAAAELTPEKIGVKFPDMPVVQAEILKTVGEAYCGIGEIAKAVPLLTRSVELHRVGHGPDHRATLTARHSLGLALLSAKPDEAVTLLNAVAADRARVLGPFDRDTFASRIDLARLKCYPEPKVAIPLFEQIRGDAVQHLGDADEVTLFATYYLGCSQRLAGRFRSAIPHFEHVRTHIDRLGLRPDHPYQLSLMGELGNAYRNVGRVEEGIRLLRAATEGLAKLYGQTDPRTWAPRHDLAWGYLTRKQYDDAIAAFEANLPAAVGEPQGSMARTALARAYTAAGRHRDALNLLEQATKKAWDERGRDDPDALRLALGLAIAYRSAGRVPEAIGLLEDVVARSKQVFGPTHRETLSGMVHLRSAIAPHNLDRAIAVTAECVGARRKLPDPPGSALGNDLCELGEYLSRAGRWSEAVVAYHDALKLWEIVDADHWKAAVSRFGLGVALARQQKYDQAEPHLTRVYGALVERLPQAPRSETKDLPSRTADELVELYAARGMTVELAKWRAERAKYPNSAPPPREK